MKTVLWLGVTLLFCLGSCARKPNEKPNPAQSAAPPPSAVNPALAKKPRSVASAWPVPTGVSLPIFPGKGLGPIRFGATVATIERLMTRECEVKTEALCGYNGRAVDFDLEHGKAIRMRIHRTFRKNPELAGASYGTFNGGFPSGIRLEMLKSAVTESLGEPKRTEIVSTPNPWNTVERAAYEGMVLEYDRSESGEIVLGGVILESPEQPNK